VIVGGGTAGWIAANILHLRLVEAVRRRRPFDAPDPIRITVVSSRRLAPVGVGESTTPLFTGLLRQLDIDEAELIRDTGATYKLGVRFEDWRGDGSRYDNPFGTPDPVPVSHAPEFQHLAAWLVSTGRPVADTLVPHSAFMNAGSSPFLVGGGDLSGGRGGYAFHLDAARLADVLRTRACEGGVSHLEAVVDGVRRDAETGFITSLHLEGGGEIAADFFLDCSGARRHLIRKELASPWESYADTLPVDSALLLTGPVEESGAVRPYTLARAAPNGWIWEIPLWDRIGRGYVFPSGFLDADGALDEARAVLREPLEAHEVVRFEPGAVRDPWIANCVAVGLAAGFVEPLEATAIHATIVQLYALTAVLTPGLDLRSPVPEPYNRAMRRFNRTVRDYLILHYLGGRDDSPFWRQFHGDTRRVPDTLARWLEVWRTRLPIEGDVDSPWQLFGARHWISILQGVGRIDAAEAERELAERGLTLQAGRACDRLEDRHRELVRRAVDHRTLLERVHQGAPRPA